jgi:hypothetical protein
MSFETMMMVAIGMIDFPLSKDLITEPIDYRRVMSFGVNITFLALLRRNFRTIPEFEQIQHPIDEHCLPVYFPDAAQWILRVITYNREIDPSTFSLPDMQTAVQYHLQSLQTTNT